MRNHLESLEMLQNFLARCIENMRQKKRFSGVKKTLNTDDLPLEFFFASWILRQEGKLFTSRAHIKITTKVVLTLAPK